MYCPKCGAMITSDFCSFCGSSPDGTSESGNSAFDLAKGKRGGGGYGGGSGREPINPYFTQNLVSIFFMPTIWGILGIVRGAACKSAISSGNYRLAREKADGARFMFKVQTALICIAYGSIVLLGAVGAVMGFIAGMSGGAGA